MNFNKILFQFWSFLDNLEIDFHSKFNINMQSHGIWVFNFVKEERLENLEMCK